MDTRETDHTGFNLNATRELMNSLRKEKWPVVKYPGFSYYPKNN